MDKLTTKAKPVLKAKNQTASNAATNAAATKAKPVTANYWASLLVPMALIAVVG